MSDLGEKNRRERERERDKKSVGMLLKRLSNSGGNNSDKSFCSEIMRLLLPDQSHPKGCGERTQVVGHTEKTAGEEQTKRQTDVEGNQRRSLISRLDNKFSNSFLI